MVVAQAQIIDPISADSLVDSLVDIPAAHKAVDPQRANSQTFYTTAPYTKLFSFSLLATLANMGATVGIGLWGLVLFQRSPHLTTALLLIVLAGLFYDNMVMLAGYWLSPGDRLKALNGLRFVIHNLCIPLLVVVGVAFLDQTAVAWAHSPLAYYGCWGMTLALIVLGLNNCISLELVPERIVGILRYKAKSHSLPIPTILTSLMMAGIGLSLWMQIQWPWLLAGTLAMLLGNATPPCAARYHICAAVELGFMLALFITASQVV